MKSPMKEFNRQMARQVSLTKENLQAFIDAYNAGTLPALDLTDEEKAQDLVEEAYKLSSAKAKKNIEKALQLDPNCIEAYEYLATNEKTPEKTIEMYDKGIAIGRKKFGGKFLKDFKGHFWGHHETRPFMRCLYQKANILMMMGKTKEAVTIMEEMLELNDGDNQGVRYLLLSALATLGEVEKFKKYDKIFADDDSTQMLYPRALFAFKTEGDSADARKKMITAFKANPFVVQFLLNDDFKFSKATSYTYGSPEEAEIYLMHGIFGWYKTDGAVEWLAEILNDFCKKEIEKQTKKAAVKKKTTKPKTKRMWIRKGE